MKFILIENEDVNILMEALTSLADHTDQNEVMARCDRMRAKVLQAEKPVDVKQLRDEIQESLLRGTFMMIKEVGFLIEPQNIPAGGPKLREKDVQLAILADDVGRLMQERANNLASCYMDQTRRGADQEVLGSQRMKNILLIFKYRRLWNQLKADLERVIMQITFSNHMCAHGSEERSWQQKAYIDVLEDMKKAEK